MRQDGPRPYRAGRVAGSLAALSLLLGATVTTAAQARHLMHTAPAPARGGSYAFALNSAPDCLDPQKTGLAASNVVDSYVFDPLLDVDTKGHYVGDLATSYKIAKGGLRVTFQLRRGVKFSNGDPFTASAVKYTFDRAVNPATKSPISSSQLVQVKSTKVINTYAVELDLGAPFRPLLTNLAGAYTGILDPKATRAQGANSCQMPIGTGPYKIQNVGPAFSTVTLVANKHHTWATSWVHNKKGIPYVSTVTFKAIVSAATTVSDLLTGGVDIVPGVPGTQLNRVTGNKKIVLHKIPSQGEFFLEFNTAHAPFDSLAGRKAVAELIDRNAIVKAAFAGQAFPVYNAIPPAIPDYDKSAAVHLPHLNTADAAKIIKADHLTGPYTILAPNDPADSTIAEILQAAAAQAGMKLTIKPQAVGDLVASASKGEFDILVLAYGYNDPDIMYSLLNSTQGGGKGLDFTNYVNPTLDRLLVKGRETLNAKKARGYYAQAQTLINREVLLAGLVVPSTVIALRSNIKGYHLNKALAFAIQDLYVKSK